MMIRSKTKWGRKTEKLWKQNSMIANIAVERPIVGYDPLNGEVAVDTGCKVM